MHIVRNVRQGAFVVEQPAKSAQARDAVGILVIWLGFSLMSVLVLVH